MRILIIIRSLERGGRERQVSLLAPELRSFGHEVCVLTLYPGGHFESTVRAGGVEVRSLAKRSRWDLIGPFRSLRAAVHEFQPDAILGMLVEGNIAAVAARRWSRRSAVAWCIGVADIAPQEYGWFSVLLDRVARRLSRRVDCIMYNSERGRIVHEQRGFPSASGSLIENAVDANVFVHDEDLGSAVRNQLGVDDTTILVGIVARLDIAKDHETFLRSAAQVHEQIPNTQFLVIGANLGQRELALRTLAEQLRIAAVVQFLGTRNDLPALYNACSLIVSSSRTEGVSNTLLEAMACGCPVVATDAGDSRRIVADPECVVAIGDPSALAAATERAIERRSNDTNWSGQLRARMIEHHSPEALAQKTISLLQHAIETRAWPGATRSQEPRAES